jgi:hypothetical protein
MVLVSGQGRLRWASSACSSHVEPQMPTSSCENRAVCQYNQNGVIGIQGEGKEGWCHVLEPGIVRERVRCCGMSAYMQ